MLPSSQLVLHYDEQHAPHKSLALLCTCPLCPSSTPTLRPAPPGHPICLRWPLQLLCQGQLLLLFCSAKHAHVKTKVFFSTTNCTQDVVEQKTVHSNGSGSGGADFTCSCGAVLTDHSIPTFSFAKHSAEQRQVPFQCQASFKFGFLQGFQAVATLQLDHLPEFLLEPADFLVRLHLALHFLLIHWRQSACRGKAGSFPFLFFCCLDPGMILSPSKRVLPCFTCFPLCLRCHSFCLSCFPLCFLFRSRCRFSQSLFPLFYLRFPKKRQHFAIPCHVACLMATATLHSYRCHAVERAGCFQG